jgi:exopolyphosphatase / guanosine-5'-triphosphate,3'-diphosphate pyrophosphatase
LPTGPACSSAVTVVGEPGRRAAVDVGTNSFRLLVVEPDGTTVTRELELVRLGQGIDAAGHFAPEAVERALACLRRFADRWRALGVSDEDVVIGATSAVRDAADRDAFVTAVRDATRVTLTVVPGEQEAALGLAGARAGLPDAPAPLLVLDVGGGSTELVAQHLVDQNPDPGGVAAAVSLQLGSVRLTERCLGGDPPTGHQVAAALTEVDARLGEALALLLASPAGPAATAGAGTLVGVAGTVTTLANLAAGHTGWVDGRVHATRLPTEVVVAWSDRLLAMTAAEIAATGAVQAGREDVLAGGVLVVRRVLEVCGHDALVVSESDTLDGLAAGALHA